MAAQIEACARTLRVHKRAAEARIRALLAETTAAAPEPDIEPAATAGTLLADSVGPDDERAELSEDESRPRKTPR